MRYDPWTLGGLILLALLSAGVIQLYRSEPQSVEQARNRTLLAARPNTFAPQLARAEERLRAGEAAGAGEDSVAVAAFAEAASRAVRASQVATEEAQRNLAREVWASAVLGWSDRLRMMGTGEGVRPDDDEMLRRALRLVDQVLAASPPEPTRQRAAALREQIRRQLRIGPLEWLPLRR